MWAGIVNACLVGWTLCFTKKTKRGTLPRVFKQCVGRAAKCEVPLGEQVRMWNLHDGTPPHFARPVTEWLIPFS